MKRALLCPGLLLLPLAFSCSGEKKFSNPVMGEWLIENRTGSTHKDIVRIDEHYFQEFRKDGEDSSGWAAITYAYQLNGDTLSTNDINFRTKKLYAWNSFVITSKTTDQLKMRTLDGEILTLNRIHSGFEKVDTTLDAVLAKLKLKD